MGITGVETFILVIILGRPLKDKGRCKMSSNRYLAVIGDIVNSKRIIGEQRKQLQNTVENTLDFINSHYKDFIVSDFLITLGDEFQGLLRPEAPLYEIISHVVERTNLMDNKGKFVEIRFGVGFGRVVTDIKRVALGMDGPAFHFARKALDIGHDKKGHTIVFRAEPNTISEVDEAAISALLELLAVSRKFWIHKSNKFTEILPLLRENKNQRDIAKALNCTQPLVSKQITSAYWNEIEKLEETASATIKTYLETANPSRFRKKNRSAGPI